MPIEKPHIRKGDKERLGLTDADLKQNGIACEEVDPEQWDKDILRDDVTVVCGLWPVKLAGASMALCEDCGRDIAIDPKNKDSAHKICMDCWIAREHRQALTN